MEFSISSVLALILLWASLCVKSAAHSDIYDRNSQINHFLVRPEHSVHIHPGHKLTLQCGAEGDEALEQFWQTPFGLFDGCNHQNKDPVDTCNGTLRISRATSSHDGLYYCVRLDETSKTIVPYRVNIIKNQQRKTREVRDTVSESHFAAAVASSVIVSFLVAFTLGAFSRSYVMKCLRTIRARMPHRKHNNTHINGQNVQATRAQTDTVFFHKNQTTGEDVVDIAVVDREHVDADIEDAIGNENSINESNEPPSCEGEEQTPELRSVASPHPKKKTRVIKLYNYDEEGNPYSHIKDSRMESEDEIRPKLRTRSLTRLNAIMKQAEALDINPDGESTDGQTIQLDAPSQQETLDTQTARKTHL